MMNKNQERRKKGKTRNEQIRKRKKKLEMREEYKEGSRARI